MSSTDNDTYPQQRPRLLDLFCGAGGATKGYQRAGFYVIGVDIAPQPYYCGDEFAQADALDFLRVYADQFQVVHASPPCQAFTGMSNRHRGAGGLADKRPDLLTPTLELIRSVSIPWVVENVPGSAPPLRPVLALHVRHATAQIAPNGRSGT